MVWSEREEKGGFSRIGAISSISVGGGVMHLQEGVGFRESSADEVIL